MIAYHLILVVMVLERWNIVAVVVEKWAVYRWAVVVADSIL